MQIVHEERRCGGGSKVKLVGETKFDDDSIITFVLRSLLYYTHTHTHTQSCNIPQKQKTMNCNEDANYNGNLSEIFRVE